MVEIWLQFNGVVPDMVMVLSEANMFSGWNREGRLYNLPSLKKLPVIYFKVQLHAA